MYWSGYYPWGATPYIVKGGKDIGSAEKSHWDPHLRSTQDVAGYHIQARDGEIGHIKDFIIDDRTWAIRYLIVETGTWLTGQPVLISALWIKDVSWVESKVFTMLSREDIRSAPAYSEQNLLNRSYERTLYEHYGKQGYWDAEMARPVEVTPIRHESSFSDARNPML